VPNSRNFEYLALLSTEIESAVPDFSTAVLVILETRNPVSDAGGSPGADA
jgi:hypothetical protein